MELYSDTQRIKSETNFSKQSIALAVFSLFLKVSAINDELANVFVSKKVSK